MKTTIEVTRETDLQGVKFNVYKDGSLEDHFRVTIDMDEQTAEQKAKLAAQNLIRLIKEGGPKRETIQTFEI